MKTFTFDPSLDWRKIGFALYSDSLRYRDVLDQNPKWNVTELPPVGAVLVSSAKGQMKSGLSQQSVVMGQGFNNYNNTFYPFDSKDSYLEAMVRYSPKALAMADKVNGPSFDSKSANTGID